ncbi:F-box domain, cyclin-like protein, partial [Cynara cardunculus var. scolymus]
YIRRHIHFTTHHSHVILVAAKSSISDAIDYLTNKTQFDPEIFLQLNQKMRERTWPYRSETSHFSTLPSNSTQKIESSPSKIPQFRPSFWPCSRKSDHRDFSALPNDVLTRIAANFSLPDLQTTSLVCKSWRDGLRPLREAMLFLWWGKRLKHGRGGVKRDMEKALDSFLKGVARGSTLAMVDAGLIYWEMGKKEEGVNLYRRAAELGDPAGQCNLGISYLQGVGLLQSHHQARKWMKRAADHGHSKALFEHGLALFSEGEMMKAAVYLELATRAGESAAAHVKNVVFQQLSPSSRQRALDLTDNWRALPSSR